MRKNFTCFFGLLALSMPVRVTAQAEPKDTVSSLSGVHELIPVEIQGIRVTDKSPFAVSDINKTAIRKMDQGRDIPYLLNALPSVTVSSDAGAGIGYTGLRIRGTDASRINFTINGIPVNDAESQAAIFVDFPDLLSSTHSVQVQRGVGSSTNGSGAFGASVNLSNLDQPQDPYAEWRSSVGSFQTFRNTLRAGTGLLKNGFQFDLRLSKITSDGYIDRSAADLKALQFIAGWKSHDERTALRFNLFTGKEKTGQAWNGVPEDSLETNRRFNGLGLMENGQYYEDQTDNYQQDYYQLFFDQKINRYWDAHLGLFLTRGIGYYNEYRAGESFSDYGRPPYVTPQGDTFLYSNITRRLWLDNYYYGLTYSVNYARKKTTLNLGGNVAQYDGRHYGEVTWANVGFPVNYRWYDLDAKKRDYSIYAKWTQRIGREFHLFADMQYRYVDYKINGFRKHPELSPHVQYNFLNPKLGISYLKGYASGAESKAYLSFAVGNKEPNRDDFEAAESEIPKHETLYDLEAGYQFRSFNWMLAANVYYMYYRNQLVLTGQINDVGAYTRFNIPESYRAGIEWEARYQPIDHISLAANLTLSKNKLRDFSEYIDDYDRGGQVVNHYSESTIAFSPEIVAYGIVTVEPFAGRDTKSRFFIDLIGKHVGRQYLDNTANVRRSIDPYTLANVMLRYQATTGLLKNIGVTLTLNNVTNTKYEANGYTFSYRYDGQLTTENYYFPQAGFNFLFGLQLLF